MRLAIATTLSVLLGAVCSVPGLAQPVPIELGRNFSLRPGESAPMRGEELRVGFEGVKNDSRCPKGEQCVWAGDATVWVWLQRGSGPRGMHELHAAEGPGQTLQVFGHDLRLVGLAPGPVTGKAIAKGDYVLTLRLSQSSASESDPSR